MRTRRRRLTPAYRLAVAICRPLLVVLTRREWRGAENLPADGGFVVAVNHLSYLDVFTAGHFLHDNGHTPHVLGKAEVFAVPVVGAIARAAEQIPVHRETGRAATAYRAVVEAVRAGWCVVIYPEGTLTRDPALWPMRGKTGAARVALETRCPVVPVAQWGVHEILPPYAVLPHLLPRRLVRVRAGAPVDLSDLYDRPLTTEVLVEATERVMRALTAELETIRGERAPVGTGFDPRVHGLPVTGKPSGRRRTAGVLAPPAVGEVRR
ncbi:MAG TPA: lysophospholipid acyltransferase family protein [Dermatophilaceae bacterium]|nr:lysophospholipid acyltransferase family protein [Dermatophilaceae bacterium]